MSEQTNEPTMTIKLSDLKEYLGVEADDVKQDGHLKVSRHDKKALDMGRRELTKLEKIQERFWAAQSMLRDIRKMREDNSINAPDAILAEDYLKKVILERNYKFWA